MDIETTPRPRLEDRPRDGFAANESGAAILEFAIVLPILLALLGGAFEIGRALLVRQTMIEAVRGGARSLARVPDPRCLPNCTPSVTRAVAVTVDAIVANAGVPRASVRVSPRWNQDAGTVTMQAHVDFEGPLLGLVGLTPLLRLEADHEEHWIVE